MGPSKSTGTGSPLFTNKSSPLPISCNALPTLPPPTITAGATFLAVEAEKAIATGTTSLRDSERRGRERRVGMEEERANRVVLALAIGGDNGLFGQMLSASLSHGLRKEPMVY